MMGAKGSAGGCSRGPTLPFDAGSAFVLATGGLRRLRGHGQDLAGHAAEESFWRDVVFFADRARTGAAELKG